MKDDIKAVLSQTECDGFAYAPVGAGNQDGFAHNVSYWLARSAYLQSSEQQKLFSDDLFKVLLFDG